VSTIATEIGRSVSTVSRELSRNGTAPGRGGKGKYADRLAGAITNEAVQQLDSLFRTRSSPGVVMARQAVEQDVPGARVSAQLTSYVRQLQERLAEAAASDTTSGQ